MNAMVYLSWTCCCVRIGCCNFYLCRKLSHKYVAEHVFQWDYDEFSYAVFIAAFCMNELRLFGIIWQLFVSHFETVGMSFGILCFITFGIVQEECETCNFFYLSHVIKKKIDPLLQLLRKSLYLGIYALIDFDQISILYFTFLKQCIKIWYSIFKTQNSAIKKLKQGKNYVTIKSYFKNLWNFRLDVE